MNKKYLDVYYYIELEGDVQFIERSLKMQLGLHEKNYNINRFINCKQCLNKHGEKISKSNDIIRSGLLTLNKMYDNLKLKSVNETWFFYICNGNIKDLYQNVFVVLLNKTPSEQSCFYIINKNSIYNPDEITNVKIANSTISEVLAGEKTITYTNLI